MKHYLLTFGLMLSLLLTGGCSKDDEPGSGNGKASGQFEIDGIKANVKYAYVIYNDSYNEYFFFDTDMMKYLGQDVDDIDKEFTYINVDYDFEGDGVEYVHMGYKMNWYRDTGIGYTISEDNLDANFSRIGTKVKIGAEDLNMEGYDYGAGRYMGWYPGSFYVEGNPKDITDIANEVDTYSRGMEIVEVTDPEQVTFLQSIHPKNRKLSRNK